MTCLVAHFFAHLAGPSTTVSVKLSCHRKCFQTYTDKIITAFVQSPSCVQLFMTPCTVARQASLSLTISQSSHSHSRAQVCIHCFGGTVQPSHPLMPSSPSALNLSQHQGLFQ